MVENWMRVSEDGATSGVETKAFRLLCGVKIDNTSLARTLKGVQSTDSRAGLEYYERRRVTELSQGKTAQAFVLK